MCVYVCVSMCICVCDVCLCLHDVCVCVCICVWCACVCDVCVCECMCDVCVYKCVSMCDMCVMCVWCVCVCVLWNWAQAPLPIESSRLSCFCFLEKGSHRSQTDLDRSLSQGCLWILSLLPHFGSAGLAGVWDWTWFCAGSCLSYLLIGKQT